MSRREKQHPEPNVHVASTASKLVRLLPRPHELPRVHGPCWLLALLALALLSGCGKWSPHPGEPVLQKVEKRVAAEGFKPASVEGERWTAGMESHVAEGFPNHPAFHVLGRTAELRHFPCSQCHEPGAAPKKAPVGSEGNGFQLGPDAPAVSARSHWNIELIHAKPETMSCATCHEPEGRMERLRTLSGESVAFDQAQRVCVQCHFREGEDWAGGAHGKRVGSWAPPRVVRGCASCHNPHQPALPKRWPVIVSNRSKTTLDEEHP